MMENEGQDVVMQENAADAAIDTQGQADANDNVAKPDGNAEAGAQFEVPRARPKFRYGNLEPIVIDVTGFYNSDNGLLEFVLPDKLDDTDNNLTAVHHRFTFSHIPYNRLNFYRAQCSKYNSTDKSTTIDLLRLRDFFWIYHLTGWNLTDDDGKPVPCNHDPNEALSNETMDILYSLSPAVLDLVISLFERQSGII